MMVTSLVRSSLFVCMGDCMTFLITNNEQKIIIEEG